MFIFIDTDPGTDDIIALIYLLKHINAKVVGLSSVFGNVGIDTTTRNLKLIAGYFYKTNNQQIEIFKGVSNPIVNYHGGDGTCVHGKDGCGQFFSSDYFKDNEDYIQNLLDGVKLSNVSAVMGLIEMSKKYIGELVIVAMGPLTNIALAQVIDREFGSRLKEIFIMGGSLKGFKESEFETRPEFNFSQDPEAVYVVLKEIRCKITILPIEPNYVVGIKPEVSAQWLKKLESKKDFLSNIMSQIVKFKSQSNTVFRLSDLMLAFIAMDPSVVSEMGTASVSIELHDQYYRGKLIYRQCKSSDKSVNVVCSLCAESVSEKLNELFQ